MLWRRCHMSLWGSHHSWLTTTFLFHFINSTQWGPILWSRLPRLAVTHSYCVCPGPGRSHENWAGTGLQGSWALDLAQGGAQSEVCPRYWDFLLTRLLVLPCPSSPPPQPLIPPCCPCLHPDDSGLLRYGMVNKGIASCQ